MLHRPVATRLPVLPWFAFAAILMALPATVRGAPAGAEDEAAAVLKRIGCTRGIVVLLDDRDARLAIALARASDLTVYVQLTAAADVDAARRASDAAGLCGTRVYIESGVPARIHLADSVADAVIAPGNAVNVPKAEVLRVLRPEGKAILGLDEFTKPFPDGVDDWSHHYHGPDNNPQSRDRLARAPYLTQFIAEPRYAPAPQAAVMAGGRIFMAFGHVAWHEREEPWLNTLIAMNAFNGTILWRRPLVSGIMVDRSTMIATPETLYLADHASCKLIDAATGRTQGEITLPADMADGTFWKWMALEDGRLFALVGADEPRDDDARWKSTNHGWPWGGISKGYNDPARPWGLARTLVAIDPKTKQVLWHHREETPIDARALCMKGGRIYFANFGKYLACLDARTGKELWRRTAERDAAVFEAIGPYRGGQGYVEGWKTAAYLKCTDKALYFIGPQVNWLTALATEDGRFLWKYPAKDMQMVIRDDGLYTIGAERKPGDSKKLDPLTGEVLASFNVSRRACTRSTGSPDGLLFRASEGSVRLDLATGQPQWIVPMRPSCHVGVLIGAGHLYWVPWACDCNLQIFGAIACAPAGDFKFDADATDADRLERSGDGAALAPLDESPADWPTYRADVARSARTKAPAPDRVAAAWECRLAPAVTPTAPVAAGGLLFLGGSDGAVRAYDAATGAVRWTAWTGGAIRYPPTIAGGRAFVGSGDGWAYAFEAATGRRLWRFRAAPVERKIAVYGALVSTWPVTGGIVVHDGTAYLAAGINNFDGTHVYALDAASGRIKWQNNTSGHLDPFSRRGVAAQGDMLIHDGKLYLAGGNSVSPAAFDLATGRCLNAAPERPGTTATRGRELRVSKEGIVEVSGQPLYSVPGATVFDKSTNWDPPLVAAAGANLVLRQPKGGGAAWAIVAQDPRTGGDRWTQPLPSEPVRWGLAVDRQGRIIVALYDGRVLCFGPPDRVAAK